MGKMTCSINTVTVDIKGKASKISEHCSGDGFRGACHMQ